MVTIVAQVEGKGLGYRRLSVYDKNTATRLQEAGITTIGDLVPNRSKHDLADNPLLNRKLRREIEARLKALKVTLSANPKPKAKIKTTPIV